MRRGMNNEVLRDKHGDLVALNFGSDYCAEHEWGIKDLRYSFGMDDAAFGVENRRIRVVPPNLVWETFSYDVRAAWGDDKEVVKKGPHFVNGFWMKHHETSEVRNNREFRIDTRGELWTGWSGSDLGAFSVQEKHKKVLEQLWDAIHAGGAVLWLGGGGVFENAGLVLGIADKLPEGTPEKWEAADRERVRLKADAEASGIEKKLREAGKRWIGLVPRRARDGSLEFCLNPFGGDAKWGFYTVQDLEDWIMGKGKCMPEDKPYVSENRSKHWEIVSTKIRRKKM